MPPDVIVGMAGPGSSHAAHAACAHAAGEAEGGGCCTTDHIQVRAH